MSQARQSLNQEPRPSTLPDNRSDALWQKLTRAANAAFGCGDNETALHGYRAALEEAEQLLTALEEGKGPVQAVSIFVISHHNIAELLNKTGQLDEALWHYQIPFDRLLRLASKSSTLDPLRQSCAVNLKEATIALAVNLQSRDAQVSVINQAIRKAQFVVNGISPHGQQLQTQTKRLS